MIKNLNVAFNYKKYDFTILDLITKEFKTNNFTQLNSISV